MLKKSQNMKIKKLNISTKIVIFLITIQILPLFPQAQTFQWANKMNGGIGYSTTTDASGNVYTTGSFQNTVDFNPNGVTAISICNGNSNVYITKHNASGILQWVRTFGGNYTYGNSIKVDSDDNVYVLGSFSGTSDFDPSNNDFFITSTGNSLQEDIFLIKFDKNANFIWVKSFGNSGLESAGSLVLDADQNPIIAGAFGGTVDFDPNNGMSNFTAIGFNRDVFICKLSKIGDYIWAKSFGGEKEDFGGFITTDISGNIFVTGSFTDWADFDGIYGAVGYLNSNGGADAFISKYDNMGNFIWVKNFGGSSFDNGRSISTDLTGNVYIAGNFSSSNFNSLLNYGETDSFICKLNSNGTLLWTKSIGGNKNDVLGSISFKNDNLYVTGSFNDTVDFDPNAGITPLTSTGASDIFILKITDAGNFTWVKKIGGSNDDTAQSINVDANENIIICGNYTDQGDFNPGAKTALLGSGLLIEKFAVSSAPLPIKLLSFEGIPQQNYNQIIWKTASETKNDFFSIEKSENGKKWLEIYKKNVFEVSSELKSYEFNDFDLEYATNYYRLKQADIDGIVTFSKIIMVNNTNIENKNISIYPNPSNGTFTIESNNLKTEINITDANGRKLFTQIPKSRNATINLKDVQNGIYFINILDENSITTKKILIEK
jgi:hypothetical protein